MLSQLDSKFAIKDWPHFMTNNIDVNDVVSKFPFHKLQV